MYPGNIFVRFKLAKMWTGVENMALNREWLTHDHNQPNLHKSILK